MPSDATLKAILGHKLEEIRKLETAFISQGQYWLAKDAEIYEARLLKLGNLEDVVNVKPFIPHHLLQWPTRKICKQMMSEDGIDHAEAMKQAVLRESQPFRKTLK